MKEYKNVYGETYMEYVKDVLDNNEVPWSKDKWTKYWKDWEERDEQEQEDD